jgi:formylglycine-generating enzyme required for sulfatase activity
MALATVAGVLLGACGSNQSEAGRSTCNNGVKDNGEEGTDCGGVCTTPCGDGGTASGANDGQKDNGETDIDCGGPNAPKCEDGKTCDADTDCATAYCKVDTKTCTTPRPDDGTKNGDETDVDCGGTVAPKCAVGKSCAKHDDCESNGCAYNGKCVARRSCTAHHGGDTCGPTNAQADCCESIAVTGAGGGTYTLDKYVVTAGRMRAFVERTGGDIRSFIQANRPSWFLTAWDAYLPTTLDDPKDGNTGLNGVYQQLGPWKLISVGGSEPGNRGCNVEGPGARTYWVPSDINNRWNDRQRYTKDDLDEKALVCVTQYMMAAFCAWDGGRLPTVAEMSYAYTGGEGRKYPWGNSPAAAAFGSTAYVDAQAAGPPPDASRFANHQYNWWSPSERIDNDYTVYIAPPGRFPDGNGKFGHSDLGGIAIEWTSDFADATNAMMFRDGSWEVAHPIDGTSTAHAALAKYYAITARCAR